MAGFWDERYATDEYLFGTAPNAFLASQAGLLVPGARALALGDGEGRNGVFLAEHGLDVLSVDASAVAQAKARKLAAERGVSITTELVDLTTWDLGEARFDLVVAIFIQVGGSAFRRDLHRRIRRALRPGGLLLLEGYTPRQLEHRTGGPPDRDNLYTAEDLRQDFVGMTILRLEEREAVIQEGVAHGGLSALVDLVARA